jgi:hypothetical protein
MIRRPKAFVLEDVALRVETGYDGGLFDVALPEPLRELPADLAAIDELLRDDAMLAPFREHWEQEVKAGRTPPAIWGAQSKSRSWRLQRAWSAKRCRAAKIVQPAVRRCGSEV